MLVMTRAVAEHADPELPVVQAILQGDQSAFEDFVRRHQRWVRGVVYGVLGDSETLDDVTQQVWSSVWRQLSTLNDPARWRSWLYRLARNAAMDVGREASRRKRMHRGLVEHLQSKPRTAPRSDDTAGERYGMVLEALRSLPGLYREPFVLRHLEGWSYQQIADVLCMPVDTVETRLVRARRHLREALQHQDVRAQ